ncbi:6-phosphogluconolactonase [soil metagenome]
MATMHFHHFSNFSELSDALLTKWSTEIDKAALARLPASFALAGGSTPAPLYRLLDQILAGRKNNSDDRDLNPQIKLVATDERWVSDDDSQSNEGLFKRCLPLTYGKQWQLVSLKNVASNPEVAAEAISARLQRELPRPFNGIVLGMGADGHIASLFPGAPTRHDDLACIAALHPQTRQSRMSLSLPRLLDTNNIWLVITGTEKRQLLETAAGDLPISALLREARCNIEVFWCP